MTPDPQIEIAADLDDLARRAAALVAGRIVAAPRRLALNLSGGSTPKRVYELLGAEPYRSRIDWTKVVLFWGDERFVPADHKDSNYRMTFEALLRHASVPPAQVHRVPTDAGSPERRRRSTSAACRISMAQRP